MATNRPKTTRGALAQVLGLGRGMSEQMSFKEPASSQQLLDMMTRTGRGAELTPNGENFILTDYPKNEELLKSIEKARLVNESAPTEIDLTPLASLANLFNRSGKPLDISYKPGLTEENKRQKDVALAKLLADIENESLAQKQKDAQILGSIPGPSSSYSAAYQNAPQVGGRLSTAQTQSFDKLVSEQIRKTSVDAAEAQSQIGLFEAALKSGDMAQIKATMSGLVRQLGEKGALATEDIQRVNSPTFGSDLASFYRYFEGGNATVGPAELASLSQLLSIMKGKFSERMANKFDTIRAHELNPFWDEQRHGAMINQYKNSYLKGMAPAKSRSMTDIYQEYKTKKPPTQAAPAGAPTPQAAPKANSLQTLWEKWKASK